MRKICLICTIFFITALLNICSARDFSNDDRWYWVHSDSRHTTYVDTKTLHYNASADTAEAWLRWEFPNERYTELCRVIIDYKNRRMTAVSSMIYQFGSDYGREKIYNDTFSIIPGTGNEAAYHVIAKLVQRDEKRPQVMTLNVGGAARTGYYSGETAGGLPDGTGSFTYNGTNGTRIIEGTWSKGSIEQGKLTAHEPHFTAEFTGSFKNGFPSFGKYYINGRLYYEGEFTNAALTGKGRLYDEYGNVTHEGQVKDGRPVK